MPIKKPFKWKNVSLPDAINVIKSVEIVTGGSAQHKIKVDRYSNEENRKTNDPVDPNVTETLTLTNEQYDQIMTLIYTIAEEQSGIFKGGTKA